MTFSEIPAFFWMVVIGGLSVLFGMFLYYLAMSTKESNNTMKEVTESVKKTNILLDETQQTIIKTNKILDETEEIMTDAKEVVAEAREMVGEVNQNIIQPTRSVGSILSSLGGVVGGFKSGVEASSVSDSEELDFSKVEK